MSQYKCPITSLYHEFLGLCTDEINEKGYNLLKIVVVKKTHNIFNDGQYDHFECRFCKRYVKETHKTKKTELPIAVMECCGKPMKKVKHFFATYEIPEKVTGKINGRKRKIVYKEKIGGEVLSVRVDLNDEDGVELLSKFIKKKFPKIDQKELYIKEAWFMHKESEKIIHFVRKEVGKLTDANGRPAGTSYALRLEKIDNEKRSKMDPDEMKKYTEGLTQEYCMMGVNSTLKESPSCVMPKSS